MGIFMYSTVLFINVLLWFSFSFSYFFTGRSGDITLISFFPNGSQVPYSF
jgi:hypothetical protein